MRALLTLVALALSLMTAGALGLPVTVTVDPAVPIEGVGPVSPMLVGVNLPVHTEPETVARSAVTPPGTNGNWEALRPLNVGLVRQWINAPECGLHDLDLPRDAPEEDADFTRWLRGQLAPDSGNWPAFDRYLHGIAALGAGVRIMLNEPVPPVWLGPFRWHDRHAGELVDLRSGEVVDYRAFVDWCGLDRNRIGDLERFERLRARFGLYMELLAAHVLADPVLRTHATMVTLGNETDSGGEFVQNSVRWRMWVYGAEANARFDAGEPARPIDEGVLQQLYLAMHAGVRAADPDGRILLGGPETSWSHNQFDRDGRFWYLDWFIDGVKGVAGIRRERLDLLTWHNYGFDYDYGHAAAQLHETYGKPTFLTEYNATAAGHGMNFMQRGAQTVAKVVIELAQTPGAEGAACFKASGGGFGLVLSREVTWRTGAYFALKLIREEIVGGQPVRSALSGEAADSVECLAVRRDDGTVALLLCNLTDETARVSLRIPGAGPLRVTSIELPIARERDDYRNVTEAEIARSTVSEPRVALAPHGVAVVVR